MRVHCTLVLPVMGLSLGFPGFVVSFTAGMVLRPISSSSGLVIGIPPGMLCERDRVLCADPSISKRVDLVYSLLICVNFVYVHCFRKLDDWLLTGC